MVIKFLMELSTQGNFMSLIGFNKSSPNNIYNSADMVVYVIDDKTVPHGGFAIGYGVVKNEVTYLPLINRVSCILMLL